MINISEEEYEDIASSLIEEGGPVVKVMKNPIRRSFIETIVTESWEGPRDLNEGTIVEVADEVTSYEELIIKGESVAVKNEAGCFKKEMNDV